MGSIDERYSPVCFLFSFRSDTNVSTRVLQYNARNFLDKFSFRLTYTRSFEIPAFFRQRLEFKFSQIVIVHNKGTFAHTCNIELQKRSVKNDGTPNLNRESADRITVNGTVPRSKRRGIFERGEIV